MIEHQLIVSIVFVLVLGCIISVVCMNELYLFCKKKICTTNDNVDIV